MKKTKNKINITGLDLIFAILIFVFTTVNFYAFLYMLRECIRYFSITYEYDIWILTLEEVNFYNRSFAAISLIMGFGSTSSFISNRPKYFNSSIRERTRTLNDSRVLNWVFIMWATELGFVFGIFFNASQSFYEFSLYPDYRFLFVLFVMVLYLQQWTNYRRQFKSLTTKLFIPISLCFVILVFVLGSLNFIDYKSLNQKVLEKNPYHKIEISKPQSKYYTYFRKRSITPQLYFGKSKRNKSQDPKLMSGKGEAIKFNNIDSIVIQWKSKLPESQYPGLRFQLNIDESIQMKFVNQLKKEIEKSGIYRIGYSVVPQGITYNSQQRYKRNIIPANVTNYELIDGLYPDRLKGMRIIDVTPKNQGYYIDSVSKSEAEFKQIINKVIKESSNYHFNLVYQDDLTYENFIDTYSIIYGTILNNRDEYSLTKYGKKYESNSREIQKEIRKKYPMNIEDSEYQKIR